MEPHGGAQYARVLTAIVRNAARNARRRHHHAKPHLDVEEIGLSTAEPARSRVLTCRQRAGGGVLLMASMALTSRFKITCCR